MCVNTCVKYFDPKFLFSSFEKILGIFCVLVAMLNAVVIGANKMSIAFIEYDIFGCRHRKLTLFLFFFALYFFIFICFLLYNIVLVLPYINMNLPWVYTCSQS